MDPKKRKGKQAPEQAPEESEPDTADEANDGAQEWMFISYPVIPIPWPIGLKRQDYFRIYIFFVDFLNAPMQEYESLKKFGDAMLTKVNKLNELSGKLDEAMKQDESSPHRDRVNKWLT